MADGGFIKIHRKILKWEWYNDMKVKVLFLHLLLLANHADKKWQGNIIERGQFITSYGKLALQSGMSVKSVRNALDKLKTTEEITVKTTNKFTMITVSNYSTYHLNEVEEGNQGANEGQSKGNQRATTKNVKNVKKIKNKEKKGEMKAELIYPDCVSQELIDKYIDNRVIIKKKMSHYAKELFLLKIQKFHDKGQDVKTLIEKAIIGGWSDIYEDKGNDNGKNNRGSKSESVKKAGTKSGREESYIEGRPTTITFND